MILRKKASVHYPISYDHFGRLALDAASQKIQLCHSTVNPYRRELGILLIRLSKDVQSFPIWIFSLLMRLSLTTVVPYDH